MMDRVRESSFVPRRFSMRSLDRLLYTDSTKFQTGVRILKVERNVLDMDRVTENAKHRSYRYYKILASKGKIHRFLQIREGSVSL